MIDITFGVNFSFFSRLLLHLMPCITVMSYPCTLDGVSILRHNEEIEKSWRFLFHPIILLTHFVAEYPMSSIS